MSKVITTIMLVVALSGWSLVAYSLVRADIEPTPFDHSVCQYPQRVSNPANGCDNSDPACPLEIKGGSCENYVPMEAETVPWKPQEVLQPTVTETCGK